MVARAHPYIMPTSEVVRLFYPEPPATMSTRTSCPHLQNALFDWHDSSSWPDGAPTAGGDVVLPSGRKLLISRDPGVVYGHITVPESSELIFDENPSDGTGIAAHGISVSGALRAGSATCRLSAPVTITLHGGRPALRSEIDALPPWTKGIFVTGTLDLHGKQFHRTWVRLAHSVQPGDSVVHLQHAVNWQPGQQVLLTTTALKDARDWHRNEVLTLVHVELADLPSGVGAALTMASAAQYTHDASDAWQGEVALLSRVLKVQGAADSEPTDTSPISCASSWILGSTTVPCPESYRTGFGGHIFVSGSTAVARVAGVELYRMGQTNVLGRYPMHFHLLGDAAGSRAYIRDSSIHRSFYRCVSVHGTSRSVVSENVAHDVIGHCYYLEDGAEEFNVFEYNLASHVHFIGSPGGLGAVQYCDDVDQGDDLLLPADVTASGFYITNGKNEFVGNAASGGWAGFAFPMLDKPIKMHRHLTSMTPSARELLRFEGNTAHSSGFWWDRGGLIYFGGMLWHPVTDASLPGYDALRYNPCRQNPARKTCRVEPCAHSMSCSCPDSQVGFTRMRHTKVFLGRGVGISHWGKRPEIFGFEAHDLALSASIFGEGWVHGGLVTCRSGTALQVPCEQCDAASTLSWIEGSGFEWYDTNQLHIVTNVTFRRCGVRNSATGAGCGDAAEGCRWTSSVWTFLSHSDQFVPQVMQATKQITYEDCGQRFRMRDFVRDRGDQLGNGMNTTTSGRLQSWFDADGSASGVTAGPILIGSGLEEAGAWWRLDDGCRFEAQGPIWQCAQRGQRQLGSLHFEWISSQSASFGSTICGNGQVGLPCVPVGFVKHWGSKFLSGLGHGLPITLNGQVTGVLGGFGWHVRFNAGGPRCLNITRIQVPHTTKLMLSVAYPSSVQQVAVTAVAPSWCFPWASSTRSCTTEFTRVSSVDAVRDSEGDTFHLQDGILTVRVVQPPAHSTGTPFWSVPTAPAGEFSRDGVSLPKFSWHTYLMIRADCAPSHVDPAFCAGGPAVDSEPAACTDGWVQTAMDQCCPIGDTEGARCLAPDGTASSPITEVVAIPEYPAASPPSTPSSSGWPPVETCNLTAQDLQKRCSCQYDWDSDTLARSTTVTGTKLVCDDA